MSDISRKVSGRFVTGVAVKIRNVAGHNWGWFSDEDERMHLQTVEEDARTGSNEAKVWLETKGRRCFKFALLGKVKSPEWEKLKAKVDAERKVLEAQWVAFMIWHDWLKTDLKGSVVTLTAYPGTHNSYTKTFDLRTRFPGAYLYAPKWDEKPPKLDFDKEHGMLAVGYQSNLDDRMHIELSDILFSG